MKTFNKFHAICVAVLAVFLFSWQAGAGAPGPKVSERNETDSTKSNKHNLSSTVWKFGVTNYLDPANLVPNTNTYRAADSDIKGQQICIFCHTPHSSNNTTQQTPLWNRAFSSTSFSRYSSGTLKIRGITAAEYLTDSGSQPDGASKLCLSCHDGVSKLGDVRNGGVIAMNGGDVITGIASFNPADNNKMKLGHHPVSFKYDASIAASIGTDYSVPPPTSKVKMDKNDKMQCTTCHNPHQNQSFDEKCYDDQPTPVETDCTATFTRKVAPFWVYHKDDAPANTLASEDHDDVCITCHLVTTAPAPW